jgi:small-conductance mechanosensitive channel
VSVQGLSVRFEGLSAAAVAFFLALLVGIVVDQLLFRFMRGRATSSGWAAGHELAAGLHGLPTVVGALIGARIAIVRLELPAVTLVTALTVLEVAAIVAGTAFAARILGRMVRAYTSREGARLPSSSIFVNLARGVAWIIGGLIILAALDVSIAPMLTALGVVGLAIGLALQPTLENLFAGVQVLMSKQVDPGDFIRLETGEEGWVQDVTWRNTTIKMMSNDLIIVPNATIGRSRVTNFTSLDEHHSVIVPVGVAYGSDLDHVEHVTYEVARQAQQELEGAVRDWDPAVRFYDFGEYAMHLRVILRVEQYSERFPVQHEFIKRLYRRYLDEGISIPFPQQTVHLAPGPSAGAPD